jgi:hypothetical protein
MQILLLPSFIGYVSEPGLGGLKSRCAKIKAMILLGAIRENVFPCLLPFLEAACILDSWFLPQSSKPARAG